MSATITLKPGLIYTFYKDYAEAIDAIVSDITGHKSWESLANKEYKDEFMVENSAEAARVREKVEKYLSKAKNMLRLFNDSTTKCEELTVSLQSERTKDMSSNGANALIRAESLDVIEGVRHYLDDNEGLYSALLLGYMAHKSIDSPKLVKNVVKLSGIFEPKESLVIQALLEILPILHQGVNFLVLNYIGQQVQLATGKLEGEPEVIINSNPIPISFAWMALEGAVSLHNSDFIERLERLEGITKKIAAKNYSISNENIINSIADMHKKDMENVVGLFNGCVTQNSIEAKYNEAKHWIDKRLEIYKALPDTAVPFSDLEKVEELDINPTLEEIIDFVKSTEKQEEFECTIER